jgi:hypothetical protein
MTFALTAAEPIPDACAEENAKIAAATTTLVFIVINIFLIIFSRSPGQLLVFYTCLSTQIIEAKALQRSKIKVVTLNNCSKFLPWLPLS